MCGRIRASELLGARRQQCAPHRAVSCVRVRDCQQFVCVRGWQLGFALLFFSLWVTSVIVLAPKVWLAVAGGKR